MFKAGIIAVGRELLTGRVRDANAAYLARRITVLGGRVLRIALVDDDPAQIALELERSLQDGASIVLTTGGLGPTVDDQTLEGVARALGRPLVLHPEALHMVEERYQALAAQGFVQEAALTESRKKMALLPEGAAPLPNPVGAAPAVFLQLPGAAVIALPGVPGELKAIFEASVQDLLRGMAPEAVYRERAFLTPLGDESRLAPLLEQVMKKLPHVYLKSRATQFGPDVKLEVILSASAPTEAEVEARLGEAEGELRKALGL